MHHRVHERIRRAGQIVVISPTRIECASDVPQEKVYPFEKSEDALLERFQESMD